MAVVWTGDRRSAWGTWQGPAGGESTRAFDDFTNLPPDSRWDRSIRMRRYEGDYSQWIPSDQGSLSRAQLQGPGVYPMDTWRWSEWWVKFNNIAIRISDDFHMYVESHTPSANPGGVWTGNLSQNPTTHTFRNWVGPGSFTHNFSARHTVTLGEWNHYVVGCRHSTGGTGELRFYRNGSLEYSRTGANTTQFGTHYPEIGFYTYWSVAGYDDMNIAGFQVHDTDPGYPGGGGGGGGGGTIPAVSIDSPTGGTFIGTLPYDVTLTDEPSGYTLYVGLGENGISDTRTSADEPHSDSLDLSPLAAQDTDTFYAALHNAEGTMVASDKVEVTVAPSEPDPGPTSLSGVIAGSGSFVGDAKFASVVAVTNVANVGVEEVTYRRPKLVEILPDGTFGAEVVWNSANGRFEYLDQQS